MEILVIARESWVCSIVLLIEVQHAQLEWMMGPLSNNSLSASFKHSFSTCFSHSLFHSYSQLSLCWLCVILLLFFWVTDRVKEFDCSAHRSGRFLHASLILSFSLFLSHRLILRKCDSIHFLSLSAALIVILRCFLSGNLKALHQVVQVPLPENSRRFPSTSLWTLFCAVLDSYHSTRQSCILSIQSIPSKLVTWTQRLFLQSQFWRPEHQYTW
jgi:hypothetical protein